MIIFFSVFVLGFIVGLALSWNLPLAGTQTYEREIQFLRGKLKEYENFCAKLQTENFRLKRSNGRDADWWKN